MTRIVVARYIPHGRTVAAEWGLRNPVIITPRNYRTAARGHRATAVLWAMPPNDAPVGLLEQISFCMIA